MVRSMMNLILDMGRNMKWTTILNLGLITLNKILKNKLYIRLSKKTMAKKILWRVTIFFIFQRMVERGRLFTEKIL